MYNEYVAQARPIVRQHGGEYIFTSERLGSMAGQCETLRMVLIKFENVERLQTCFKSAEYAKIKHLRENSTVSETVIIED